MGTLTPLGQLLESARQDRGWSQNQAARYATVSGTTWRNVIRGTATQGGREIDYPGRPANVARMARAVGLTVDEVRAAGRDDVADVMENDDLVAAPVEGSAEDERPVAPSVDTYQLVERVVRLERMLRERDDRARAAELDRILGVYEQEQGAS